VIPVPTIDISNPSTASLEALDDACRDHGFFLLVGHGLDEVIERTWTETRAFFDADRSVRVAIMRTQENPLGYFDRELTKRKRDTKEVFDYLDPSIEQLDERNRWPEGLPGFRHSMVEFFEEFSALADRTLGLLHDALELSERARPQMIGTAALCVSTTIRWVIRFPKVNAPGSWNWVTLPSGSTRILVC
jgi:isopenicillin N synthase-like dioxygenase